MAVNQSVIALVFFHKLTSTTAQPVEEHKGLEPHHQSVEEHKGLEPHHQPTTMNKTNK